MLPGKKLDQVTANFSIFLNKEQFDLTVDLLDPSYLRGHLKILSDLVSRERIFTCFVFQIILHYNWMG